MAIYDIIPSQNLHYSDVRDTINANGGVANNEMASAFQDTAKINIWSKYKPIDLDYIASVPDSAYKNANYGFGFGKIIFGNPIQYGTWKFNKAKDIFRLEDFRRYKPSAQRFYLSGFNELQTLPFSDSGDDSFFIVENIRFDTSDTYILSISDFNFEGNSDIRLGIIAKKPDGTGWEWSIAGSGSNMIPANQWRVSGQAKREAWLILCTSDFQPPSNITDVSPVKGTAYPLPNGSDLYADGEKNAYHVYIVPAEIVKKLTLKEVSNSLNGTFKNWYDYTESSRLSSYLGAFYMKLYNSTTKGFAINLRDLRFTFSSNLYDGNTFTTQRSDGLFTVYDKNKSIIQGDISIDLNPGEFIYVGGENLLNKGYTDAPRYPNINVNVSVYADTTSGANLFGPIYVTGTY